MLQINPKKFKTIKNKTIPSPLRPKFRKKAEANIYFLSQRKVSSEKKSRLLKNNNETKKYFYYKKKMEKEKKSKIFKTAKIWLSILALVIGGYLLSN